MMHLVHTHIVTFFQNARTRYHFFIFIIKKRPYRSKGV